MTPRAVYWWSSHLAKEAIMTREAGWRMTRALALMALVAGCSKPATGAERGSCYGNGTCNAGLTCDLAGRICVAAPSPPPP